jgi:hypothetical protein
MGSSPYSTTITTCKDTLFACRSTTSDRQDWRGFPLGLANGERLTATEGHPFKTAEGWHDAVTLKKGGKLLLKGADADSEPAVKIVEIRAERKTLPWVRQCR